MIALIRGKLASKDAGECIIDVGGVGYRLLISLTTYGALPSLETEVSLHTHTHVREDQLLLYGFVNPAEKHMFQKLISISGVGPRMAITMLSAMNPHELGKAIASGDHARMTSIPGVGTKTAQRIVVELKEKLKDLVLGEKSCDTELQRGSHFDDVCSALTNLGYTQTAAENALKKISNFDAVPLAEAIKQTLKELSTR